MKKSRARPASPGRVLVTGAAGFVGSNLALELEARGHEVVAIDDFTTGRFENLPGFQGDLIAADLADSRSWEGKVGRVDAIFHQAAITDTTLTDSMRMMRANVEAFRALLSWALRARVKKIVYASSAAVYGTGPVPMRESSPKKPTNIYGFSKHVMENAAGAFSKEHPEINLAGLRYFNVFGPRESFKGAAASMIWQLSRQMRSGRRPRVFEFGEQYRDHVYVKDVVRANLLAAEKGARGAYNVCTGEKTTFNEIIRYLNRALGTDLEPEYFKNPYSFYQNETLGDSSLAARELGFRCAYTVEEGISDYLGRAPVRAPAGGA